MSFVNVHRTVFKLHNTFSNACFNFIHLMETKFYCTTHVRRNVSCTRINLIGIRFRKACEFIQKNLAKTSENFPEFKTFAETHSINKEFIFEPKKILILIVSVCWNTDKKFHIRPTCGTADLYGNIHLLTQAFDFSNSAV